MVSDREDGRRGEITVAEDPRTAAHLVETLLEAGFEQDRIKLFSGNETEIRVRSRPVVALLDEDSPARSARSYQPAAERSARDETVSEDLSPPAEGEWQAEPVSSTPWVKDGVRFSSLFRAS
jgi:hypothetical protein